MIPEYLPPPGIIIIQQKMVEDIWLYYGIFLLVIVFTLMMAITYLTGTRVRISQCVNSTASYGVLPGYSCPTINGSTVQSDNLIDATMKCNANELCQCFLYDGVQMSICDGTDTLQPPADENTLNNVFIKQNG